MIPNVELPGSPIWWVCITAMGGAVGFIGGLFGVGGNFLLIPILTVIFRVPLAIAIGTSLCQIIGTGSAALYRHNKLRQGEIRIDWLMLVGGLIGANAGAGAFARLADGGKIEVLGHYVPLVRVVVSIIYSALLTVVAIWMLYDSRTRKSGIPGPPGPLTKILLPPLSVLPRSKHVVSSIVIAYLGLLLGFLSGLVGMGGGVVLMPILIYGLGMNMRMAAGTGILVLVASAMMGTFAHVQMGHVHLGLAMSLLAGSTLGAPIGANMTSKIDGQQLRGIFAYLVFVTTAAVLWDLWRIIQISPISF